MWRFKKHQTSGFTLLEVMIATAIIAIALVAALGSQSQSVSLANEAKFATTVAFLAQKKMAELEAEEVEDVSSDTGDFGEDFPGYRWESEVDDASLAGSGKDHIRKIRLSVYRAEDDRLKYNLTLYRFKPD
jgi:general secretion pathway protein I